MTDTSELVKQVNTFIAEHPTEYPASTVGQANFLLSEQAQAIERLKGERDNAIEQAAMECAVVEELDKTCKALRQQLDDARAKIEQLQEHISRWTMGEAGMRDEQIDAAIKKSKREALATPAPMDELQQLGQEYDAAPSEVEPHTYSPDYTAMGDCKICGHVEDSAVHKPAPSTGEAERHTFEPLLAPVEPDRPWLHNYAVCRHCGKTEKACRAAQQQESGE